MTRALQASDAATIVGIVATCAVFSGFGLGLISRPSAFKDRLAVLETKADEVTQVLRPRREELALQAVCVGDPQANAAAIKGKISDYGGQRGLEVSTLTVTPDAADRANLTPVRIRFQVRGPYDASLELLDMLARSQPRVYVDTIDLTSNTTSVSLAFSGRAFCAG